VLQLYQKNLIILLNHLCKKKGIPPTKVFPKGGLDVTLVSPYGAEVTSVPPVMRRVRASVSTYFSESQSPIGVNR